VEPRLGFTSCGQPGRGEASARYAKVRLGPSTPCTTISFRPSPSRSPMAGAARDGPGVIGHPGRATPFTSTTTIDLPTTTISFRPSPSRSSTAT
jgi:hypothetical protein